MAERQAALALRALGKVGAEAGLLYFQAAYVQEHVLIVLVAQQLGGAQPPAQALYLAVELQVKDPWYISSQLSNDNQNSLNHRQLVALQVELQALLEEALDEAEAEGLGGGYLEEGTSTG
eukprot:CAMPEP_0170511188 /NCGR_PEP_ID=MMETSP0208-20121228/66165_1 /TAXON_ID=197538 /ORGANISM="Strombidium inclinatum, Strain S3" /LENGTH=119 /DNA_ID=CAMNT_0010794705 /DNA_START=10 /DNA_END=369 /DNA_ORIENTATION=+